MIDLLGERIKIKCLYKRNIDNFFKLTTAPFIISGLTYFGTYFILDNINIPKNIVYFGSLSAGISGFCRGIKASIRCNPKNESLPWKGARYLDDKINELF
jgi:hypothetical protein